MAHQNLEPATVNRFPHENDAKAKPALLEGPHGDRLQRAITALYNAFSSAQLALPLRYCPHCFTASDAEYILKTPLHDLTISDISFIFSKATTTLGTDADFNYFLPRIFEAWALQAHYLLEALPESLKKARDSGWSATQTAAVVEFVDAFVSAVNDHEYNDSAVFDLKYIMPGLRIALPELRSDLEPRFNNLDAELEDA